MSGSRVSKLPKSPFLKAFRPCLSRTVSSIVCFGKQPCSGSGWRSSGVPPGLIFSLLYLIVRTGLFLYLDVQCQARGTRVLAWVAQQR